MRIKTRGVLTYFTIEVEYVHVLLQHRQVVAAVCTWFVSGVPHQHAKFLAMSVFMTNLDPCRRPVQVRKRRGATQDRADGAAAQLRAPERVVRRRTKAHAAIVKCESGLQNF